METHLHTCSQAGESLIRTICLAGTHFNPFRSLCPWCRGSRSAPTYPHLCTHRPTKMSAITMSAAAVRPVVARANVARRYVFLKHRVYRHRRSPARRTSLKTTGIACCVLPTGPRVVRWRSRWFNRAACELCVIELGNSLARLCPASTILRLLASSKHAVPRVDVPRVDSRHRMAIRFLHGAL